MKNKTIGEKELMLIFEALLKAYGKRRWWPAKTKFEMIVGAILTQNVSWRNAKIGIENLKRRGLLSPRELLKTRGADIAKEIKSTRFYNQKTKKLKNFCRVLIGEYNGSLNRMFARDKDTADLREELLNVKGVGKETADSIILYAGGRLSFVSDAYTRRFVERYGIYDEADSYEKIRSFFMERLPKEVYVYNEFHALIDHHCYLTCKKTPTCKSCAIRRINDQIYCSLASKRE
jgi:endonuclease III related protein